MYINHNLRPPGTNLLIREGINHCSETLGTEYNIEANFSCRERWACFTSPAKRREGGPPADARNGRAEERVVEGEGHMHSTPVAKLSPPLRSCRPPAPRSEEHT